MQHASSYFVLLITYTLSALYRNNPSATAVETPTEQPPAVTSDDAASADVVLTAAEVKKMSYL